MVISGFAQQTVSMHFPAHLPDGLGKVSLRRDFSDNGAGLKIV